MICHVLSQDFNLATKFQKECIHKGRPRLGVLLKDAYIIILVFDDIPEAIAHRNI